MMKSTSSTNQNTPLEENMSNLTSASGEASVSNDNNNIIAGNIYPPQYNLPTSNPQPPKKKRNQPGHPDPEAEVIALSPRTLLATNRFVCDVCNKGFQRDQNLQLHRRGHNLPWKLKQRANKDVIKKKVYVCPETSCVHHDPSRALGDLTGIKKHFSRKHGEKKWKCEKCSKKYAVQSDWKAHSKTCGTREYRCDCGTLFSRRDSFITHRAFCDALAEESARSTIPNKTSSIIPPSPAASTHHINLQQLQSQFNTSNSNQELTFQIKKEHHQQNFPPWLTFQPPLTKLTPPPQHMIDLTTSSLVFQDFQQHNDTTHHLQHHHHHSSNPNPSSTTLGPTTLLPPFTQPTTPHISATALLQKAAQLGAKSSNTIGKNQSLLPSSQGGGVFIATTAQPHQNEVSASDSAHCGTSTTAGKFGLNLSTFDQFVNGMTSYGNKAAATAAANVTVTGSGNSTTISPACETGNSLLHDMMMNNGNDDYGLTSTAFEDVAFGGILINNDNNNNHHHHHVLAKKEGEYMHATLGNNHHQHHQFSGRITNGDNKSSGHGNDTSTDDGMMTRDFLGLRPLSESDMLSITGLSNCMSSDSDQINHVQKSWQGN